MKVVAAVVSFIIAGILFVSAISAQRAQADAAADNIQRGFRALETGERIPAADSQEGEKVMFEYVFGSMFLVAGIALYAYSRNDEDSESDGGDSNLSLFQ